MKFGFATIARRFAVRSRWRQQLMPFLKRMKRMDRIFRGLIATVTGLVLAGTWIAWPSGRSAVVGLAQRAKWGVRRSLGYEPARSEIDGYWRNRRDQRQVPHA